MSLTVPFAGTDAGRAARAQEVPTSNLGSLIAGFGEQLNATASKIEAERLDREMRRLQVDMTRDLGQLRLQAEEIGDPDKLDAFWSENIGAMRDRYLTGTRDDGRPIVDPKLRDDWEIGFDDLANKHGFAIGQTGQALRQSQRVATYIDYRQEAGTQAAATDPGTRDQLFANHDAEVDRMVADGIYTPERGAVEKQKFRAETEGAHATLMLSEDPQGVLDAIDAGDFAHLSAEDRAGLKVRADAAIAAAEDKALKAAELTAREESAQIKGRLSEANAIVSKGRATPDETLVNDPVAQAEHPELVAELRGAISLRDRKVFIDRMTPAELEALADELKGEKISRKWQTEELDAVETRLASARTELARDPVAYVRGVEALPVAPLDFSDAGALEAGLKKRAILGQKMKADGWVERPVYLDLNEQAELKAKLDPKSGATPAERARLAGLLAATVGVGALGDDAGVTAHVGGLLQTGGAERLGADILRGQEELARKTVILPPVSQRADALYSQIGGLFDEMPVGGARAKASIFAAADALYVARHGTDASGEIDSAGYAQALHEVMGGTGTQGAADATGGIQAVNGEMTFMPVGLGAARTDLAIDRLVTSLADAPVFGGAEKPAYSAALKVIEGAGNGSLPVVNGSYMAAEDWEAARFIAVGNDRYEVLVQVGDTPVKALDPKTGEPFSLSLMKLTELAERQRRTLALPAVPVDTTVAP